jgi:uncharacterized protein YjbI with pentapeptide repeats
MTDNAIQPRQETTTASKRTLTREDLLRMIEENGGPEGLNLRGADLSQLDLSKASIDAIAQTCVKTPPWLSKYSGGLRLTRADLCGADLSQTNLEGANLSSSNLEGARLWRAYLRDAEFWRSNLDRAILCGTFLERTRFVEASLRGVHFYYARLENAYITRDQLGGAIAEELKKEYAKAHKAYIGLKRNFDNIGRYADASWAYIKERQMRKKTHWPPGQARACFPEELENLAPSGPRRLWQFAKFYAKHLTSYLGNWLVEVTSGYGEKPLRTLWWALAIIVIFPVFYCCCGGIVLADGSTLTWLDYLNYSFGAFTTTGFARFETTNWMAETLTSLEALLGISVLALLMFALGNRISRS